MQHLPPPRKQWSENAIRQLKRVKKSDFIKLLRHDESWAEEPRSGAPIVFKNRSNSRRVSIHYHRGDVYHNTALLKQILEDICWTEEILLRKKIIK